MIRYEQMKKQHWIDLARDDFRSCRFLCRVYRSDVKTRSVPRPAYATLSEHGAHDRIIAAKEFR